MTDRIKGYVVALEENVREDDAEAIINAIRMVKGVISVQPVMANSGDYIIQQRTRQELMEKIYAVLHGREA